MKRREVIAVAVAGTMALSGCDTVRNGLGLDHYQPDEFAVPDNPPLSIPKDHKLRPPHPGAKPTQAVEANVKAQRAMGIEAKVAQAEKSSGSEAQLVTEASHVAKADPKIRDIVNSEAEEDGGVSETLMGRIRSWKRQAKHNVNPANKPIKTEVRAVTKPTQSKQDVQDAAAIDGEPKKQQGTLRPINPQ